MSKIQNAIIHFFRELEEKNIRYAILRKAERVPENVSGDIDIVIGKEESQKTMGIIRDCAEKFGLRIYERQNVDGLYCILYGFELVEVRHPVDVGLQIVRLDFTNPVENPSALLEKRLKNEKGIYYIPEGLHEKKQKSNIKNILTYPWRLIFPPGKFVIIVGPDGVGKSTTAELVAQILAAWHVPVWHKHMGFRPKVLPARKDAGKESNVPGLLRFLYHTLDHILGFWFVVRPMLVKGKIVLGERYYYNFLIDPRSEKRYGVPRWLLGAAWFFTPKPDVVILLSNTPEVIHERRQEHSVEEISRQQEEYRKVGMKAKTFLEVRTDKVPFEVAEDVARELAPKKYKLAIVASHPIQYQSPLWREIAKHPEIDVTVYYSVNWGVAKPQFHTNFFNKAYKWDIPLLEEYKFKFLRNYSPKPGPYLGGFINPGIFWKLWTEKYDAVLVMGWMDVTFWFAFLAAKIRGTPALLRVVNSNYYDAHVKRPKLLLWFKKLYLKILFHGFIKAFLAIGTWNKNMFLEYGVPKERIFHFPYAVWNEFFMSETEKHAKNHNAIKKELGLSLKTKVIAYAARFAGEKRPHYAIQAYERLIKNTEHKIKDVCLLMIGDGLLQKEVEEEVKQKGLKNVYFLGFKNQTELVRLYAITDIFIRTDEPIKGDWGATVNEAMACGLPIVAPDTLGAQADLIRQGENGFVYRFGDIDALARYMEQLIQDEKLLESMKKKSKEIISKWSYKEDVEGLIEALRFLH